MKDLQAASDFSMCRTVDLSPKDLTLRWCCRHLGFHDGVRNLERALKPPHLSAVGICARLWLCSLIKLTQRQFDVCSTYAKGSGLLLHDSETIELRKDLLNYIIKQREYRVRKLLYFWLT